ncbi:FAD-binding oxidoreductase [Calothrix sp. UHCC 0171]|uniref:FAD-binding oxidoreductase n=1 Tax=Calothrix sp. UHCC 0171 TaxID=3110245 RepID=UPI002B207D1C|nr:FAD-binding oxidoreductase [Calothrix sp. UHCC 0171]MEA5574231.1 FAD-binding oxidoreductase [Calothrix sp. UHCC 0171]
MSGEQIPLRDTLQEPFSACSSYFASVVGEDAVCLWEDMEIAAGQRIRNAFSISAKLPSCIVYPQSQAQLGEVITLANQKQLRVLICGSASKLDWGGSASEIDVVICTKKINQLIEHAVGDLTVTVEAGMKFADLQKILAKTNQFLAIDPTSPAEATIGGIIATADTGSLRQRYGSDRDQLLGITFVRPDGEIVKAGGRVVKNVAGYDLMKLFTGSYGTLGVITQATFRLYPMQETSGTVVLTGTRELIQQAADILRGSALTPTKADLLSAPLVSQLGLGKGLGLITCFESIGESVKEQSHRLVEVGEKLGLSASIYSADDEVNLWERLKQLIQFSGETATGESSIILCKVGLMPTVATELLNQVEMGLIHMSSGLGMLRFVCDVEVESKVINKLEKLRFFCQENNGFLTILAAPTIVKQKLDVWGYAGNSLSLMRRIKQQFDPNNILNPGRFVGGI